MKVVALAKPLITETKLEPNIVICIIPSSNGKRERKDYWTTSDDDLIVESERLLLATILWVTIMYTHQAGVLIADNAMDTMIELNARKPYCIVHNDRNVIQRMLFNSNELKVRRMANENVGKLARICRSNEVKSPYQGGFIYPGTKWCGPGNVASNYDDLGVHEAEDKCCREHDNCPNALLRGECRQGICNDSPYTRSHCDCDAELRRCLQNINTETANTIGAIFFNVIQITCFKERRPCSQWQSCQLEFQRTEMYFPTGNAQGKSRSLIGGFIKSIINKICLWKRKINNFL